MKIRDFSVKGFRSLADISLTDFKEINVFFGDNNSGKSNILESIEFMFKVDQKDFPVNGFYRGALSNFVDNFNIKNDGTISNKINLNCKIALGTTDIEKLPVLISFLKQNNIFSTHNQFLELEVEITPINYLVANRVLKLAKINSNVMYDDTKPQPGSFFPNLQNINKDDCEKAAGELIFYVINAFNKIHTGRFPESRESKEEKDLGSTVSIQGFKSWLRAIIESRGENYKTYQKIQKWFEQKPFDYGIIRPILAEGKTDILITDFSGRELMLERLGTGVQQILILLSQISDRVYTNNAKIFGIEELELNMSPNMQREALKVLDGMVKAADNFGFEQLFLTTHSPYLCNRDFAELYAVSMDKTTGTSVSHGEDAVRTMISHFNLKDFNLLRRSEIIEGPGIFETKSD